MQSVLVGMFDSHAEADAARTQLMAAGFTTDAVAVAGGSTAGTTTTGTTASTSSTQPQGGIGHFFERLFGSDDADDADRVGHTSTYTEAFDRGSYALSVTTSSETETDQAEDILNAAGAVDIDERSEAWRKEGWTGAAAATPVAALAGGDTQKLQEVQEELKVGKQAVARGGVRVFTRMTDIPVEESIVLREEHADIRRTVVDRPVAAADLAAFQEGSIEVRESSEEAVVSKTARVVGEVEVGKTITEREETIRDTVRETRVEVEQIAGSTTTTRPKV